MFRYYLPLERVRSFIWTNLDPPHPRMVFAKFGWNWLSLPIEGDFKMLLYFRNYLPCRKIIWFSLLEDALCQVWLKLARWFWRRCKKNFNVFSLLCPLWKWRSSLFEIWIPYPKNVLCYIWLKLAQCRKGWKCEKFTDRRTDRRQTTGDQKNLYVHICLMFVRIDIYNVKNVRFFQNC